MQIGFRQATEADLVFLDAMQTSCIKPHVIKVYEWDSERFCKTFDPRLVQIILYNEVEVGMLQTSLRDYELYLGNLLILPAFQNRGIGTAVIDHVLEQAKVLGLPTRLQVLKKNPARRLYERLGFQVVEETETHRILYSSNTKL